MEEILWRDDELAEPWQLYATWPGGLLCTLTTDDGTGKPPAKLPLYVWTHEGEQQTFISHDVGAPSLK